MDKQVLTEILERAVSYHPILAKALGNVPAAVMLSQGIYWHKKTKPESDGWFWVTAEEWYEQTGVSKESQQTARKHLKAADVWEEKLTGVPAKMHYRIKIENVVAVIARYLETANPVAVDYRNKKRELTRTGSGKFLQQGAVENGNYTKNNKDYTNNSLSDSQAKSDRAPETQTVAGSEKETGATAGNTANSPTPQSPPPQIGYTFEQFWNDYAHKVGSKVKCEKAFVKLTATEREQIRATLPAYKRETVTNDKGREKDCFKPMRQHPLTYLNGRMWVTYSERTAKEEAPTPFDEAYNVYLEWVSSNFPQAYQSAAYFSKSQFIEFKTGSKAQIIGRESERDFVKKAHERAPLEAKDAYSIYQHLLSHRLSIRTV